MNKKKIYIILLGVILVVFLIIMFINSLFNKNVLESSVGSIAYNANSKDDYRVYIKEEDKYIPYLVLDYDYNNTGNSLLLREFIIGNESSYTIDEEFNLIEEKDYKTNMEMKGFSNYDETDVDKYLKDEFHTKIDEKLLARIFNTKLEITNNIGENENNYRIYRKFFLLSLTELGLSKTWDNNSSNNDVIEYFNSNTRIAKNEIGTDVIWWTRSYCWGSFCSIGYNGSFKTEHSTGVKYGIRPAFTISKDTKIKKMYLNDYQKEVNIFNLDI